MASVPPYQLGPSPDEHSTVQLSSEALHGAQVAAAGWGRSSSMPVRYLPMRACFENGLIGVSPPMLEVMERIAACCDLDAPVLIAGEPGTEQEVAARCVHLLGQRAPGKFVRIRCDGLTRDFVQSKMARRPRRVPGALATTIRYRPPLYEPVDTYVQSRFEFEATLAYGGTFFSRILTLRRTRYRRK